MTKKFSTIQLDRQLVFELIKLKYQNNEKVKTYNEIIKDLIIEYKKKHKEE